MYDTNQDSYGSAVYLGSQTGSILIVKNTTVICNSTLNPDNFDFKGFVKSDLYKSRIYTLGTGAAFLIWDQSMVTTVQSINNRFKYCINNYQGSIFRILSKKASFSEENSIYENNQAYFGGNIFCENCLELSFIQPTFVNNNAYRGGSIYLSYSELTESQITQQIFLDLSYFKIISSSSFSDGGFLYVTGDAIKLNLIMENTTYSSITSSLMEQEYENTNKKIAGGGLASLNVKELDLTIRNCDFNQVISKYQAGGLFNIQSQKVEIDIQDVVYNELNAKTIGGILYIQLIKRRFYNLVKKYYIQGLLYCICILEIDNITCKNIKSQYGTIIYINGQSQINVQNSIFHDNAGAFLYENNKELLVSNFYMITSNKFYQNEANLLGGLFYLVYKNTNLTVNDSVFHNNFLLQENPKQAVIFQIENANQIYIDYSNFTSDSSNQQISQRYFQVMYSEAFNLNLTIFNSLVQFNQDGYDESNILNYINLNTSQVQTTIYDFQGIFYLKYAFVTARENRYLNNYVSFKGGVFSLSESTYNDTGSLFENNVALFGGVIQGDSVKIYLESCISRRSIAQSGAFMSLVNNCQGEIKNMTAIEMQSIQGGFLSLTGTENTDMSEKQLIVRDSEFKDMRAFYFGGFASLQNQQVDFILQNITVSNTYSHYGSLLNVIDVKKLVIKNSYFYNQ
ncbi:UNKNOWN [Stylonychia lemnae]|uniref:Uncharacterized protein n=1 Tax=Stylonychia lemnae TaxID=5949 RepID=A0A078AB93_STYLE|nr:UNKNOWN [Stylonychia lemnae]|eukprot:CDW78053.1 UNKNOWN [Stylonychia lemnae]